MTDPTQYEKPLVVDLGDIAEITEGTKDGDSLDAAFPVHTPKSHLTFS